MSYKSLFYLCPAGNSILCNPRFGTSRFGNSNLAIRDLETSVQDLAIQDSAVTVLRFRN